MKSTIGPPRALTDVQVAIILAWHERYVAWKASQDAPGSASLSGCRSCRRQEATRLIDATRYLKNRAALSVAYGGGLRAREVVRVGGGCQRRSLHGRQGSAPGSSLGVPRRLSRSAKKFTTLLGRPCRVSQA